MLFLLSFDLLRYTSLLCNSFREEQAKIRCLSGSSQLIIPEMI